MSDFRVGQKVVCVSTKNTPGKRWPFGPPVTEGEIYTVRDVLISTVSGEPSLRLLGVEYNTTAYGRDVPLLARRFRPLEEKSDPIELFRQMCRDAEAGKLVSA